MSKNIDIHERYNPRGPWRQLRSNDYKSFKCYNCRIDKKSQMSYTYNDNSNKDVLVCYQCFWDFFPKGSNHYDEFKLISGKFINIKNKNYNSKINKEKSVNSGEINFEINKNYKRIELHEQYGGRRQSGISNCPKFPIIFIFTVDKHEQHGYKDGWDNDGYFWYSGEGTEGDMTFTGGNNSILNQQKDGKRIFLFKKSKKSGYWTFIDEFNLVDYRYYDVKDKNGDDRKGIQFKLLSITKKIEFDKIEKEQKISNTYNHNKPDKTEREGLVTSRVGQGFYRQQILEKWDSKCSVTGCELTKILISSHIVPWSKSNDSERLDVGNGLLLSPDLDSLFDKHLISFEDSGNIIISDKIDQDELELLGININMELRFVTDDMKPYLSRHREVFYQNTNPSKP